MSEHYAEKELKEFREEAIFLAKRLNEVSDKIKTMEQLFRDNNMNFPFYKILTVEEDNDVFLSWELDENLRSTFRLYLIKTSSSGIPLFKHVFMETKLTERLKYVVFLDAFLEDFTHHLRELNESL